ncbi:integrase core domain-containing protein [Lentisalinibacter sediminis]|uniref:integrase core domain-containing protein n=1 Tax=Lentisalinibacter sediminis TaxID=2992237 RepID=UPI003863537E
MPGFRGIRQDPLTPRDRRAHAPGQHPRCGTPFGLGEWPEFVSRAILKWLSTIDIHIAFIRLGKPWQNAANESFNDKFRQE